MPVAVSYPGIYVEEIPSGVRTITGVATSITAFIGRAKRGPVDKATFINSFGDFERRFGGLDVDCPMSYAVRDFYLNGGAQAIIVRLYVASTNETYTEAQIVDLTAAAKATAKPVSDAAGTPSDAGTPPDKEKAKEEFSKLEKVARENQRKLEDARIAADTANTNFQAAVNEFKKESERLFAPPPEPNPTQAEVNSKMEAVVTAETNLKTAQGNVDNARFTGVKDRLGLEAAKEVLGKINNGKFVTDVEITGIVGKLISSLNPVAKDHAGTAVAEVGGISLVAASPGVWANNLVAKVDRKDIDKKVADRFKVEEDTLFNLTILAKTDDGIVPLEKFQSLSVDSKSSRRVDRVLDSESDFVNFAGEWNAPSAPTDEDEKNFSGGNDGASLENSKDFIGAEATATTSGTGMHALDTTDLFNLLCIPPDKRDGDLLDVNGDVLPEAMNYCAKRRAMLIVDPPPTTAKGWRNANSITENNNEALNKLNLSGPDARNAAIYFPRVKQADPLRDGQIDTFVPCGIVAGVMSRTDRDRGVWKAPAGIDAAMNGVRGLAVDLNDSENGMLNPLGINCLRSFPVYGRVVWGARTLRGADRLADEYKYIPVRRTALYIEESLFRGLKWVVFEPNDEPLWAQIRLNVGAFMHNLFRQGAFQGKTRDVAYFVKCDKETTTQNDINLGIVNIHVGFAPLKPAEFVIIKLQQMAGQIEV